MKRRSTSMHPRMRRAIRSVAKGTPDRRVVKPVDVGSNGLPVPCAAMLRAPVVLCGHCNGSGWDPCDPTKWCGTSGVVGCGGCGGYRGIINLPWRPTKSKVAQRLSPTQVEKLRRLDCTLPDYPVAGGPEWDAFVVAHSEAVSRAVARAKSKDEDPDVSLDAKPGETLAAEPL